MGGDVQEWCSSLFGAYPYDPTDGREAYVYNLQESHLMPKIWETGTTSLIESAEASVGKAVLRGGSWRETKFQARCAYRGWAAPMHRSDDTGFRDSEYLLGRGFDINPIGYFLHDVIVTPVRDNRPEGFLEQLYGQNRAFTLRVLRGAVQTKSKEGKRGMCCAPNPSHPDLSSER
jgi:hypothetical protein